MDMLLFFDKNKDETINFEEFVEILMYKTDDRYVDNIVANFTAS